MFEYRFLRGGTFKPEQSLGGCFLEPTRIRLPFLLPEKSLVDR